MRKLAALIVICFIFFIVPGAVAGKNKDADKFNKKFEFTGVTLEDANTTVNDGNIEAASKSVDDSQITVCGYYTSDWEFLGQHQDSTFASQDDAEVQCFCVSHFGDRQ